MSRRNSLTAVPAARSEYLPISKDCRLGGRNHDGHEAAALALELFIRTADRWLAHEDSSCACGQCTFLRESLAGMYYTVSIFAANLNSELLGGERAALVNATYHLNDRAGFSCTVFA